MAGAGWLGHRTALMLVRRYHLKLKSDVVFVAIQDAFATLTNGKGLAVFPSLTDRLKR
jgi:hypothetical protein